MKNLFFAIVGPSGAGKNTIMERAMELLSQHSGSEFQLCALTTATTRDKREGEVENVHHYFISREAFEERIQQGELLEYTKVHGNYYGVLKATFENQLNQTSLIKDIDANGALSIKKQFESQTRCVLLMPPSVKELEKRLIGRGQSSQSRLQAVPLVKQDLQILDDVDCDAPFVCPDLAGSRPNDYDLILYNKDIEKTARSLYQFILAQLSA